MPTAELPWVEELCSQATAWGVNTRQREACLVGQLWHESLGLTRFEENLNYKSAERIIATFRKFDLDKDRIVDPEEIEFANTFVRQPVKLANWAYANRLGNGPPESGDGWRYRGRGPIQTTFLDNYQICGDGLDLDLLGNPDALLLPEYGIASALLYWSEHGCNELADRLDHQAITKAINGGFNGLDERIANTNKALGVL